MREKKIQLEGKGLTLTISERGVFIQIGKRVYALFYNEKDYNRATAHGYGFNVVFYGQHVSVDRTERRDDGVYYYSWGFSIPEKTAAKLHEAIGSAPHQAEVDIEDGHVIVRAGKKVYRAPVKYIKADPEGFRVFARRRVGIDLYLEQGAVIVTGPITGRTRQGEEFRFVAQITNLKDVRKKAYQLI